VEARHLTRLSRALRTSGVNGVAAAFRGEAVFASGCSVLDRGYITVRPLYSAKTTMVSAFSENRAVRTSEVQDPETDFGQHCTVVSQQRVQRVLDSMQPAPTCASRG
jgi:hypothetical protein